MGPSATDCCHRQCVVGCTGPTDADCIVSITTFDSAEQRYHLPFVVIYRLFVLSILVHKSQGSQP